ncbi:hypothetical protein F5B20DRAFT_536706 [Whalleya microplaca]|nr:hypothetical protein F5B20DRAFT_536706 [Whalleya microplaca]
MLNGDASKSLHFTPYRLRTNTMRSLLRFGIVASQLVRSARSDNASTKTQSGSSRLDKLPSWNNELAIQWEEKANRFPARHGIIATRADTTSPCTDTSFNKPEYKVSGFQFNKTTTPRGDRGLTNFQLQDVANNVSMSCTTPYLQDINNPMWNDCGPKEDEFHPWTTFQYTASEDEVAISQTWICEQENKSFPHPYFSSATLDLTTVIQCVDDEKQTTCTAADDEVPSFSGDYVIPVWNSDQLEIIPPSPEHDTAVPWNPSPCIGVAFSYPNWDVDNFTYNTIDDGISVSFQLKNHANNQSVACIVQGGDWSSCDNSTDVRFIEETNQLSINQTWSCNGGQKYPKNVTFRAVGNASIDAECDQDGCNAAKSVIKGSLTQPIELTPNVAPFGVNYPGCLEKSETPSWEVTSWEWKETWTDGYGTGSITAIVHNLANGWNVTCKGYGRDLNRDSGNNDTSYYCDYVTNAFDSYAISSFIHIDPTTGLFSVDQRWQCNGHDDKLPAKFKAYGTADNNLECSWENNTETKVDERTCYRTELPFIVTGNVLERTELAAGVFDEVPPDGYSCTISSVLTPGWQASYSTDTIYVGPTPNSADSFKTMVNFLLQNNQAMEGFQRVDYEGVSITPFLPSSEPARWYDCVDQERNETSGAWARQSLECKWQLDLATGYFAINHTWYCDDKDPDHPILFTATGSAFWNTGCYVNWRNDQIECNPTNSSIITPTTFSWDTSPDICLIPGRC